MPSLLSEVSGLSQNGKPPPLHFARRAERYVLLEARRRGRTKSRLRGEDRPAYRRQRRSSDVAHTSVLPEVCSVRTWAPSDCARTTVLFNVADQSAFLVVRRSVHWWVAGDCTRHVPRIEAAGGAGYPAPWARDSSTCLVRA
jgi:hypothetical protein